MFILKHFCARGFKMAAQALLNPLLMATTQGLLNPVQSWPGNLARILIDTSWMNMEAVFAFIDSPWIAVVDIPSICTGVPLILILIYLHIRFIDLYQGLVKRRCHFTYVHTLFVNSAGIWSIFSYISPMCIASSLMFHPMLTAISWMFIALSLIFNAVSSMFAAISLIFIASCWFSLLLHRCVLQFHWCSLLCHRCSLLCHVFVHCYVIDFHC